MLLKQQRNRLPLMGAALASVVLTLGAKAEAQSLTTHERVMTVAEAMQIALTNSWDIRISAENPLVDKFSLNALYSTYDPVLGFTAQHAFVNNPGGVDPETGSTVSFSERYDNVSPSLSGALPFGTTFELTGPQTHQSGPFVAPDASYSGSGGVSIDQPLLRNFWTDTPRMNIAVAKQTLRFDELGLRLQVMTTINSVLSAYYNLIYDRENVDVEKEAVKLADELANEDKQKAQLGAMTPLDAASAQAQAQASRSDLLTAQLTLANQANSFKSLLSLDLREWAAVTPVPAEKLIAVPESPNVFDCWRNAVQMRPDLLQAKVSLEKQKITIKYDFNQLFPQLDVQASYTHNGTGYNLGDNFRLIQSGATRSYSYGAVLNMPLDNVGARGTYKSAKVTLEQLILQFKKTENIVVVAVQNDVETVDSDLQKIDTSRAAREYAEQALAAEQTKLDHGSSTTLLVLQAQQTLTLDRSAEIRALADYNIAVQQLAFDDGTILERNKILWPYP